MEQRKKKKQKKTMLMMKEEEQEEEEEVNKKKNNDNNVTTTPPPTTTARTTTTTNNDSNDNNNISEYKHEKEYHEKEKQMRSTVSYWGLTVSPPARWISQCDEAQKSPALQSSDYKTMIVIIALLYTFRNVLRLNVQIL